MTNECIVCLDFSDKNTRCINNHIICMECYEKLYLTHNKYICPICRLSYILNNGLVENIRLSEKILPWPSFVHEDFIGILFDMTFTDFDNDHVIISLDEDDADNIMDFIFVISDLSINEYPYIIKFIPKIWCDYYTNLKIDAKPIFVNNLMNSLIKLLTKITKAVDNHKNPEYNDSHYDIHYLTENLAEEFWLYYICKHCGIDINEQIEGILVGDSDIALIHIFDKNPDPVYMDKIMVEMDIDINPSTMFEKFNTGYVSNIYD